MLNKIKNMANNAKRYEWEGDFKALVNHINQEISSDSNWNIFEKLEQVSKNLELKKMMYELIRSTDGGCFFSMNMNLSILIDSKEEKIIDKVEYMMTMLFLIYKNLKNGDLRI